MCAFCKVKKGQEVAVKYPRDSANRSECVCNMYKNEIEFLRFVSYPFIIRLLGLVSTDDNPLEWMGEAYFLPLSKSQQHS